MAKPITIVSLALLACFGCSSPESPVQEEPAAAPQPEVEVTAPAPEATPGIADLDAATLQDMKSAALQAKAEAEAALAEIESELEAVEENAKSLSGDDPDIARKLRDEANPTFAKYLAAQVAHHEAVSKVEEIDAALARTDR